jgi:hypothetical protein
VRRAVGPSLAAVLALTLLGSACGGARVTVKRRVPAEIPLPAGHRLAVVGLEGEDGDAFGHALTAALVNTGRFELLERRRLDAAVTELKLSAAGFTSDDSAKTFGELTGADALITGAARAEYVERTSSPTDMCEEDGTVEQCETHRRTAEARLAVELRVVAAETGRVLVARSFDTERRRVVEGEAPPPELGVRGPLLAECRAELVDRFVGTIAPHEVSETVDLRSDDRVPELERGHVKARIGNWKAAIEQYRAGVARAEALEDVEPRAAARYDLGVALAFDGDFAAGLAELERAFAEDPAPLYRKMIERVRRFAADAERLRAQEAAPAAPAR